MKKIMLFTIAMLWVATMSFAQTMDLKDTIIQKEKGIMEMLKKGDIDGMKANLADDYMGVYGSGIFGRMAEEESLSHISLDSNSMHDGVTVLQPAEGVVIIAYGYDADGMYDDQSFSGTYYATSTWVKRDGKWMILMHTEAEAMPEDQDQDMD